MIAAILIPFVVFALALVTRRALIRHMTAAQRHLLLVTAFTVVALVPAVAFLIPVNAPGVGRIRSTVVLWVTPDDAGTSRAGTGAGSPVVPLLISEARSAALWMWGIGAALLLVRIGGAIAQRRRVPVRPAVRAQARLRALTGNAGRIRVQECDHVLVPETRGALRPVILLPAAAREWDDERLDFVLTHELIHILRHDWAFAMLAELVTAAHWYNPLAWRTLHALRQERELACDDEVLNRGIDGIGYAGHLVEIAASPGCRRTEVGAVAMAHVSNLETRVRFILRPDIKRGGVTMKGKLMAAGVAAVMVVLLSGMQAPAQGNAALSGTVQDASGAYVPGAVVLVKNTADRNKREIARTDDAGVYNFAALPPGRYEMEVAKPGFQLYRHDAMELIAGTAHQVSVTLQIGKIAESLTVTGVRPGQAAAAATAAPKRINVGGNMQFAKLVKQVRPAYPPHLKDQGVEGTVLLDAVISREGLVMNLQPANSLVHPDLVASAMEAVKQWEYEPTFLNGNPVEVLTSVQINYTLQK